MVGQAGFACVVGMKLAGFLRISRHRAPDFDDLLKRIEGCEIILPERTTWYGMREIAVREPGGHTVVFAATVPK